MNHVPIGITNWFTKLVKANRQTKNNLYVIQSLSKIGIKEQSSPTQYLMQNKLDENYQIIKTSKGHTK